MVHTSDTDSPPQHDILDVANWFLSKSPLQHKKLQKLCYYAVSWHYTLLDSTICIRDEFQAWIHGPVSPPLFSEYKSYGWVPIPQIAENIPQFSDASVEVLDFVWESYGDLTQFQLENLTHSEPPWQEARGSLPEDFKSTAVISVDIMKEFYRELFEESQND